MCQLVCLPVYLPAGVCGACVWPCEPLGEMDVWERAGGRPESRFGDALRLQLVVVLRASGERAKFMNGPPSLRSVVRRDAIRSSDLSDRPTTDRLAALASLSRVGGGRVAVEPTTTLGDQCTGDAEGGRAAIKCAKNGAIES